MHCCNFWNQVQKSWSRRAKYVSVRCFFVGKLIVKSDILKMLCIFLHCCLHWRGGKVHHLAIRFLHTMHDVSWATTWRRRGGCGAGRTVEVWRGLWSKIDKRRHFTRHCLFCLCARKSAAQLSDFHSDKHLWCVKRHLYTKSSLMSVQSSGSLEGTPSLVPALLHVPEADCVFSNIPRQGWRPGKVLSNISVDIMPFWWLSSGLFAGCARNWLHGVS